MIIWLFAPGWWGWSTITNSTTRSGKNSPTILKILMPPYTPGFFDSHAIGPCKLWILKFWNLSCSLQILWWLIFLLLWGRFKRLLFRCYGVGKEIKIEIKSYETLKLIWYKSYWWVGGVLKRVVSRKVVEWCLKFFLCKNPNKKGDLRFR